MKRMSCKWLTMRTELVALIVLLAVLVALILLAPGLVR